VWWGFGLAMGIVVWGGTHPPQRVGFRGISFVAEVGVAHFVGGAL
jgi:hypothetical protein